jgi:hypothetical protein
MKIKYKHSFDRIVFSNRWKIGKYTRNGDWVILGIQKWFFSSREYEYRICFFGFDIRIWLKREPI